MTEYTKPEITESDLRFCKVCNKMVKGKTHCKTPTKTIGWHAKVNYTKEKDNE